MLHCSCRCTATWTAPTPAAMGLHAYTSCRLPRLASPNRYYEKRSHERRGLAGRRRH